MAERYDVAVVGAGCIGASVAKHVAEAGHSVLLVEQEKAPALHQSGRNSGVIHVGYNQEPGTTKARYCVEGSRRMRAYCAERDVAMVEGGILVVASRDEQRPVLAELHARGRQNGADVHLVDRDGIEEHEPYAVGVEALWAPEGASVDPVGYTEALVADARAAGAVVRFTQHVADIAELPAKVTVNAAGLQADRLAGPVASDLRVVPFRGFYARVRRPVADRVRSHVYAAPDPAFPFLGVHLSRRVDGSVMAGPGAMLAFGREAYRLLAASGRDLASMAT